MSIAVLVLIVGLASDKQKVVDQKHLNMKVCTKNVTLAMILCFYFLINFLFYYSYAFSYCLRIAISYIFNNFYLCYLDIYPIVTIILPYFQVYFILFINIKKKRVNDGWCAGPYSLICSYDSCLGSSVWTSIVMAILCLSHRLNCSLLPPVRFS